VRCETSKTTEEVSPDQHPAGINREYIADPIVLLLIDLVEIKRSRTFAQPIYGDSNSLHTRAFLKMHDLWSDNPCIRLQKFINQPFEGVGFRDRAIFNKPKPSVITFNQGCGLVGDIRQASAGNFADNFGLVRTL
jgi:hypothetical protein